MLMFTESSQNVCAWICERPTWDVNQGALAHLIPDQRLQDTHKRTHTHSLQNKVYITHILCVLKLHFVT